MHLAEAHAEGCRGRLVDPPDEPKGEVDLVRGGPPGMQRINLQRREGVRAFGRQIESNEQSRHGGVRNGLART